MPIVYGATPAKSVRTLSDRPLVRSLWRGACRRCPSCGIGPLFRGYLATSATCSHCGQDLSHHRADDAPPYFVILIAGHIVVAAAMSVEAAWTLPLWVPLTFWPLFAIALCLVLLPPTKGALIGLQWALRMHGFDPAQGPRGTAYIDYDPLHEPLANDPVR